jgi:hypothetical protein
MFLKRRGIIGGGNYDEEEYMQEGDPQDTAPQQRRGRVGRTRQHVQSYAAYVPQVVAKPTGRTEIFVTNKGLKTYYVDPSTGLPIKVHNRAA